jgi:catabolite regulation protein CreA
VIATPDTSGVTCYVTKSATSFDITCSANALVDYVVIPRIRVLQ